MIQAARQGGLPVFERDFSLFDVYSADEAFVTGTFAGLTPVASIDGRHLPALGSATDASGPVTQKLRRLYRDLIMTEGGART